jgi:ribosomal protein S18 acetylase RimI-like enzyme
MDRMDVAVLESAMDAAWPAPEREGAGPWVLRAASGVTQRANSVWPRNEPTYSPADRQMAFRAAELWYRGQRLPVIFQVFEDSRLAPLNALLDEHGYTRQSETLVMERDGSAGTARADRSPDSVGAPKPAGAPNSAGDAGPSGHPAVEIRDEPSAEWLRLWWSVDGRGGADELAVARGILTGCPSLYALVRGADGAAAAVGRLALSNGRGGLYCMATRPDARRQGLGRRIMDALLAAGAAAGVTGFWLLVTAPNSGAQELYGQAGFAETGRYLYRQERPKRHLTGC